MGSTNHWDDASGNALLGMFFVEHLQPGTRAAYHFYHKENRLNENSREFGALRGP